MKIYNTLSQKKEPFTPLAPGRVGMYVCGPTVYDVGHLGHGRAAVAFDVIRRYFRYKGFTVNFISNITDVDDKIIKRAKEQGITEQQLAEKIIPEYQKDYAALNVLPPDHAPRATDYIPQMVALIEKLLQRGAAYETESGIYFEVAKFTAYGKLSHQRLEDLKAGARIEVDEKKKNPLDFALWKKAKPGEPAWEGPAGMQGRPGWHMECSAMSAALLGETFDIHGGGIDLQFPHHECEIAQSETAHGKTFARYWLHNGHVQINKEKMSKSLGNFFTIQDVLKKYHPLVVRYSLLSTHYRMPIEFSEDILEQAKNSLGRLHDFMRRLGLAGPDVKKFDVLPFFDEIMEKFEKAMDDDFEISEAIAAIFEFVKKINRLLDGNQLSKKNMASVKNIMEIFDTVFGVLKVSDEIEAEIQQLIQERDEARDWKDFKRSDEIRDRLKAKGIILEDTPEGARWKRTL